MLFSKCASHQIHGKSVHNAKLEGEQVCAFVLATIYLNGGKLFYLQLELFCLQLSFFAYSPLRPLLDALSHCKQKSSKKAKIVSKKAKIVSKKAKIVNCKWKSSTVSRKLPTVSRKAASEWGEAFVVWIEGIVDEGPLAGRLRIYHTIATDVVQTENTIPWKP